MAGHLLAMSVRGSDYKNRNGNNTDSDKSIGNNDIPLMIIIKLINDDPSAIGLDLCYLCYANSCLTMPTSKR